MIQRLIAGENEAWSCFLFDVERGNRLTPLVDTETAKIVLTAGGNWNGAGWNTSKASRKLWETIRVPIVNDDCKEYLNSWLYALSLAWQVEVPGLALSDRASEAAFQLMEAITTEPQHLVDKEEEAGKDTMKLDWEEQEDNMAKELVYLWEKPKPETN